MLEAPEREYASESAGPRRVSGSQNRKLRRDLREDFADDPYEDEVAFSAGDELGFGFDFADCLLRSGDVSLPVVCCCCVREWDLRRI